MKSTWVEPTHLAQTEFTIRILSVQMKNRIMGNMECGKHIPERVSSGNVFTMLEDRLTEHLNAVDDEAQERMDILVRQMMEKEGITEEMKACDQMEWVRAVNNIRNVAEEIVLKELVYI